MNKKGFTLIELLGILALLGVIIVVAMPNLIESKKRADANEIKDACDVVMNACESYRIAEQSPGSSVTISQLQSAGYLKSGFTLPSGLSISSIAITSSGCTIVSSPSSACSN